MNTRISYVPAGVVLLVAMLVLPLAAQAQTVRPPSGASVLAAIYNGDEVMVAADGAPLMIGNDVLARLPRGRKFPVTAIEGPWLGTWLEIGGRSQSGWVRATDVVLARSGGNETAALAASPITRETERPWQPLAAVVPTAAEPAAVPVPPCPIVEQPGAYYSRTPGFYNYNWSGHSEPDPDVHQWEPWRHGY
jgi:hypothetical protein